jgi:hypothetical protein
MKKNVVRIVAFLLLVVSFFSLNIGFCNVAAAVEYEKYVGDAFDSLSNSYFGRCIENIQTERLAGVGLKETHYDFIESTEQLKSFYNKAITASLKGTVYGVTADASFQKNVESSSSFNSNTIAIAIMYKYNAEQVVVNGGIFNQTGKELIEKNQKSIFFSLYGNSYVKTAYLGGVLFVIYTAEITDTSKTSKEELRFALNIKYSTLVGAEVTTTEKQTMEETLKKVKVSGYCRSTDTKLNSNDVIQSKDQLINVVESFTNYYENVRMGLGGEYYVYARELAPYNTIAGSGYYDSNLFPNYYNPSKFTVSNVSMIKNSPYSITLFWEDVCDYEDGYKIYCKASNKSLPIVLSEIYANTISTNVSIPLDYAISGYNIWVVPTKDGYEGTVSSFNSVASDNSIGVTYIIHCRDIGWLDWVKNGETSGTTGQDRRMEAIKIKTLNLPNGIGVKYKAYVADLRWLDWVSDGQIAGTTGQKRRAEALMISLTNAPVYLHIKYRVHARDIGWMDWVVDGQIAGTIGEKRRLEAVEIKIIVD